VADVRGSLAGLLRLKDTEFNSVGGGEGILCLPPPLSSWRFRGPWTTGGRVTSQAADLQCGGFNGG
jgi:hypothetical protein